MLCIGACFESWVKALGAPLFTSTLFERILGSKMKNAHGICYPKFYINLGLSISVRQTIQLGFNSMTPLFVRGNLSIKTLWIIMC